VSKVGFGALIADLDRALASLGTPYMLIGGLAAMARGVVRQTDDADATVWAAGIEPSHLLATMEARGFRARIDDPLGLLGRAQVLLLRHGPTGIDVDLSAAWLPFEAEAMARAERLDVGGHSMPVVTAEDLVIYKAVAWRERDRSDIERLLRVAGPTVDRERVLRIVGEFAEILEEPRRVEAVRSLLDAAGG